MRDEELVDTVAKLWVSNGGDSDGFLFLFGKIIDRIKEMEGTNE